MNFVYRRELQKAYQTLAEEIERRPDLEGYLALERAECALLVGRVEEALQALVPVVRTQPGLGPIYYVMLSIASSAKGEVYPGQSEYVRKKITDRWTESRASDANWNLLRRAPPSAKSVLTESLIALKVACGRPFEFLELALKADPTSELAALELAEHYNAAARYSDLRKLAQSYLPTLPNGSTSKRIEMLVADAEGKADRPYRQLKTRPINP